MRLTDEFERFHSENPHVYEVLVALCREFIQATGHHRLGIGLVYGQARWKMIIMTSDPEYKLNNNHRAFYARLIMAQEPDLHDLFELRCSEADIWFARWLAERQAS